MKGLIESAVANPWRTLQTVLDGPLHPGGREATEALLDRADVTAGTRMVDVGCGAGEGVATARRRGADAVGVDRDPDVAAAATLRGDLTRLPLRDGSVDVVLGECVYCLVGDRDRALTEARRVLRPDGRLALSDVVVEGDLPPLPDSIVRALCLEHASSRSATIAAVEDAGFAVDDVRDHREDLLRMRDEIGDRIDYERLLPLLGEHGADILDGIEALEAAAEEGRIGYVSLVASR
ncbi:methyltransferase domain-containing protein [Halorubrum sp. CBA1125]|uniref:class I SAM-dependent methyltransferase n=1 Tax=Halorubrum sp. CBA1125 TaxID=2668072 RepID=UPI0012E957D5|nr:methyltransferase domain-containing protein [Halorubrum sp. CBA1125]MUW13666.1 methyltransferase domain-containing protein [Halorubrum sp. CBA1125]